jgi:hypothetical protein
MASEIGPSRSLATSKWLILSMTSSASGDGFIFLRMRVTSRRRICSAESSLKDGRCARGGTVVPARKDSGKALLSYGVDLIDEPEKVGHREGPLSQKHLAHDAIELLGVNVLDK